MKFVFRRLNYKGRNSFSYTKAQTQYKVQRILVVHSGVVIMLSVPHRHMKSD